MFLYVLAAIGAVTVILVLLVLVLIVLAWLQQPVTYKARAEDVQRFLASWGAALAEGGKISVGLPGRDPSVIFVKRRYKKAGSTLVLRVRSETARPHFEEVQSALSTAGVDFQIERTPAGRPRAIIAPFPLGEPVMLSSAAHAARVALRAIGGSYGGLYELKCHGSHRPDCINGSVQVIPWTRGYRAGFYVGQVVRRILGS